jgi:hypothetical protein
MIAAANERLEYHYCSWPAVLRQATSYARHVQCSSAHGLLWHHAPAWLLRYAKGLEEMI